MPQTKQCPKCSGSMAEGFVMDGLHGGVGVSTWVEGAPEKSVWMGLKLSGRMRSEISAWRCARCGFVEHYALAAPSRNHEAVQRKQAVWVVGMTLGILLFILGAALLIRQF